MAIRERLVYAIDVVTDGSRKGLADFKKAVGDADGAVGKFKAGWGSVLSTFSSSPVAIGAAGAAVGAFAAKAVGDASNLEESINAVNVAYEESAAGVHALGEQSAESFGLSQRAFNEFSVQFSAFADKIATGSGRDVVDVLGEMTTRISDFASVNNLDMAEAAQIFQSSLAGETEALRRYGGDVSAAAVEQFALEKGLIQTKSELTESIKVQARYGLLMQETAKTAGDFANTTGSLANQQKILSANVEDLSASFGKKLTPIVADAAETVNNLIASYDDLVKRAPGGKGGPVGGLVSGLVNPFTALGGAMEFTAGATDKLDRALGDSKEPLDKITDGLNQSAYAARGAAAHMQDAAAADAELADAERDQAQAVEDARQHLINKAEILDVDTVLTEKNAAAQEAAAKETERLRKAAQLAADAIRDQTEATLEGLDGMFDYETSVANAWEANDKLRQVLEETPDDLWAVREAQIEGAEAALQQAEAFAKQEGATEGSVLQAQLMKLELEALQAKFPGLNDAIQGYIDKLNSIPAMKTTQLVVTTAGAVTTKQTLGAGGRLVAGAEGAIVTRPTGALIGEAGPEAVIPLDKMPGASPLPGGLGGSGATYNIYVTANGDVVPEKVVDAIKKFERQNGTAWRS